MSSSPSDTRPWYRGLFGTDATPGPYEGFTRGDVWNGWAVPVFEKEQADRIAADTAALKSHWGEFVARFDEKQDAYVFHDPGAGDPDEPYKGFMTDIDGQQRKVYPIGTSYWTWEQVEAQHE